ncbi:MAG: hypothetical protein ABI331_03200 [Gemmatimonadaceae bacterium]
MTRTSRAGRAALRCLSAGAMSLGVVGLMLNVACYAYNPQTPGELKPGEDVFVHVNAAGRAILSQDVGDSVDVVEGKYVSGDAAGVQIAATDVQFISGISSPRSDVAVTLPRAAYDSVTTKKLAIASTGWLIAGIVAGVIVLITGVNVLGSGTPSGKGKPPTGTGN